MATLQCRLFFGRAVGNGNSDLLFPARILIFGSTGKLVPLSCGDQKKNVDNFVQSAPSFELRFQKASEGSAQGCGWRTQLENCNEKGVLNGQLVSTDPRRHRTRFSEP